MGLFSRKNKNDNAIQEKITSWNKTAVDYAKSFSKSFDYSKESIADLEEILQYYHEDIAKSMPTENQLWSMSCIWGTYLGEVLLRNGLKGKGFEWDVVEDSVIPVLKKNDEIIAPIDKVYKRFVNGSEDNVISFLDYVISTIID